MIHSHCGLPIGREQIQRYVDDGEGTPSGLLSSDFRAERRKDWLHSARLSWHCRAVEEYS